jgi:hypothetical protein
MDLLGRDRDVGKEGNDVRVVVGVFRVEGYGSFITEEYLPDG